MIALMDIMPEPPPFEECDRCEGTGRVRAVWGGSAVGVLPPGNHPCTRCGGLGHYHRPVATRVDNTVILPGGRSRELTRLERFLLRLGRPVAIDRDSAEPFQPVGHEHIERR